MKTQQSKLHFQMQVDTVALCEIVFTLCSYMLYHFTAVEKQV